VAFFDGNWVDRRLHFHRHSDCLDRMASAARPPVLLEALLTTSTGSGFGDDIKRSLAERVPIRHTALELDCRACELASVITREYRPSGMTDETFSALITTSCSI
jgi:hypothetical protein